MGTTMLGGSSTAAIIVPQRSCDADLDLFESDETADRVLAVELCEQCPLLAACRNRTRAEILDGRGPVDVVQAAVAWTFDVEPDPDIHGIDFRVGWLPSGKASPASEGKDIDPVAVALVFTDPDRVRDTLTASERDEVFREAARKGMSLNFLRKALKEHPREADATARRLGIRDAFAMKPKKKVSGAAFQLELASDLDAADSVTVAPEKAGVEDLSISAIQPDVATKRPDRPAEQAPHTSATERVRRVLDAVRARRASLGQTPAIPRSPRRIRRLRQVSVDRAVDTFFDNTGPMVGSPPTIVAPRHEPGIVVPTIPLPQSTTARVRRAPSRRSLAVSSCGELSKLAVAGHYSDGAHVGASKAAEPVKRIRRPQELHGCRRRRSCVDDGRSPPPAEARHSSRTFLIAGPAHSLDPTRPGGQETPRTIEIRSIAGSFRCYVGRTCADGGPRRRTGCRIEQHRAGGAHRVRGYPRTNEVCLCTKPFRPSATRRGECHVRGSREFGCSPLRGVPGSGALRPQGSATRDHRCGRWPVQARPDLTGNAMPACGSDTRPSSVAWHCCCGAKQCGCGGKMANAGNVPVTAAQDDAA